MKSCGDCLYLGTKDSTTDKLDWCTTKRMAVVSFSPACTSGFHPKTCKCGGKCKVCKCKSTSTFVNL